MNEWYKNGLQFQCTECGKCCHGKPGFIWISEEDVQRISEFLKVPVEDFMKRYVRYVNGRRSLIELPGKDFSCIFLKGKKCSIYPVRPKQCRTFPWWPQNLENPKSWKEAAKTCEGIRDDAPVVSYEEIKAHLQSNNFSK